MQQLAEVDWTAHPATLGYRLLAPRPALARPAASGYIARQSD
ncbi:hypothetical protein [Bradyrhizobium liaoningense]|nr:hypothetical protein [Bradyrhizobium liaoningense]